MKVTMNKARSIWANAAVREFRRVCDTDEADALGDLLCNLRHWAKEHGYDYDLADTRAAGMFIEEGDEDGEVETYDDTELKKDSQDWTARALGTFIFGQSYKVQLPDFPLNAVSYPLVVMIGSYEELISACKQFVDVTQPLLEKEFTREERGG